MHGDDLDNSCRDLFEATVRLATAQREQLVHLSDAVVSAIRSTDKTLEVMAQLKKILCPDNQAQGSWCPACGMGSMAGEPGRRKCGVCDFGEP